MPNMFVLVRKSWIYLSWASRKLVGMESSLKPRKKCRSPKSLIENYLIKLIKKYMKTSLLELIKS